MKKILLLGSLLFLLASSINAQFVSEGFETGLVDFQNATGNVSNFTLDSALFNSGTKSVKNAYLNNAFDTLYQTGVVDLTTSTNPQLIFSHIAKLESGWDEAKVLISTDGGSTYTVLPDSAYLGTSTGLDGYVGSGHFDENSYPNWIGFSAPANNTWWQREAFDLSAYATSTTVKVIFVLTSDASGQREGWYLDDISIESVACPILSNFRTYFVGPNSANLTWNHAATDSVWSLEYGVAGFTPGTGTTLPFTTSDSVTIPSLSITVSYDVYVRGICRAGDTSAWVGPLNFTTRCAVDTIPYLMDFDTWPPSCWDMTGGANPWIQSFPSGHAEANFWTISTGDYVMSSPAVHTDKHSWLKFSWSKLYNTSYPGDSLRVLAKLDTDVNWDVIWSSNSLPTFNSNDGAGNTTPGSFKVQSVVLDSAKYMNKNVMVRFQAYTDWGPDVFIDDVIIEEIPSCPNPDLLGHAALFSDSVVLSWVDGLADSIWQVQYGSAGFALGAGTTITDNNDSITFGGLIPSTSYDVYLRSICTVGDTSIWIGPYTFLTPCSFYTPPYTEDFATMNFANVPLCWEEATGPLNVNSTLTMGASQWTSDGFANVGFAGAARLNIAGGRNEWLISPSIDLGNGSVPYQVEFDVALTDGFAAAPTDNGTIDIDDRIVLLISTDNGLTWSDTNILREWDSTDIPSHTGEYFSFDLTSAGYSGIVRFALYGESTSFIESTDFIIDNFGVVEVPTCPRPLSLRTAGVFADSVNVTWDSVLNGNNWIAQYGPSGFVVGSGTSSSTTSDTARINGLTPNTAYDLYLISVCAVGDSSVWVGPITFSTPCAVFSAPFLEDFATMTGVAPACWQEAKGILNVNSSLNMGTSFWANDNFGNVAGASNSAKMNVYSTGRTEWLISPSIDLGDGTIPYQVEMDVSITDYLNPVAPDAGGLVGPDDRLVLVISTDNGLTWSDTNILQQWDTGNMPSVVGDYFYFDLTAAGYTGIVQFGIYAESTVSNEDNDFFIDNFGVVVVPTCPRPVALAMSASTQTTANFSWTNGANDVSWIMEYGAVGFTQGTGTTVSVASNPGQISGLNASTCYDVYLRSICAVGDTSLWIGPSRFCTECGPVVETCEDFESVTSGLPLCWQNFVATTGTSNVQVSTFGGNNAPNSLQMTSGNDATSTLMLISPEMTALGAGTHRAVFWLDGSFNPDTTIIIGTILDPLNPGTFVPLDTINDVTNNYQFYSISFTGYTGPNRHIAFLYNPTATFRSMAIDDFCFEEIPSCEKAPAVDLLSAGVDSTSMDIGWNLDTSQVSYLVAYGPAGYDPITNPANGDTVTALFNFRTVTGLEPLTEYCFWVKAICTNGDTSFWDGPHCGPTGCPASYALPYSQDFTNYVSLFPLDQTPECWEEATGTLTASGGISSMSESNWEVDGFANVGFTGAARFNFSTFTSREGWIVSPTFNFGTDPNRAKIIEFDVALTDGFSTAAPIQGFRGDDTVALVASYDGGITWEKGDILITWDSMNEPSNVLTNVLYEMKNVTGTVTFGFYGTSPFPNTGNDVDFFVDNFSIRDTVYLSLNENIREVANYSVFPNPNTGLFTVLNEGGANQTSLKVMDIQGRIVYDETYFFNTNARKEIDVNALKAGVYVLLIQSEGKLEQHRIIINK